MVTITIDKKYSIPENWDEITLSKTGELFALPMPERLIQYYKDKINSKPPDVTEKDLIKVFPEYYGRVLNVFGVPHTIVKKIMPLDRSAFYNRFLLEFVLAVHFSPNYIPLKPEYIMCEGEKLYFPKSKEVLGNEIPAAYTSAWEFSEIADLEIYSKQLSEGKYGVMANIASIMCRPIGEEYDEDTSLQRAEKLKDMKMSDVWEVFFCLIESLNMQIRHDQMYLSQTLKEKLSLPLHKRALVRGTIQLSKWVKRYKALTMSKK